MVACSPCNALIETAKLTIDLILTYILDLTLPPSCPFSLEWGALRSVTTRGRAACLPGSMGLASVYED